MAFTATSSAFAATLMVFKAHNALLTEMSWAFSASSEISREERAASAAATSAVVWADVACNRAIGKKLSLRGRHNAFLLRGFLSCKNEHNFA